MSSLTSSISSSCHQLVRFGLGGLAVIGRRGFNVKRSFFDASRVPADILLEIFFILMSNDERKGDAQVSWDWVAVTKVCGHWRRVALECPRLWSRIFAFKNVKRVQVFLQRSKQVELYVDLGPSDDVADEMFAALERHMWKVRELKTTVQIGTSFTSYWKCISAISGFTKVLAVRYRRDTPFAGIPYIYSANPAIRLHSLSLFSVATALTSAFMFGLAELVLEDVIFTETGPKLPQILGLLEQSPGLRRLKLKDVWQASTLQDVDPIHYRTIILPRLQRISLQNLCPHICFALVQFIKFPTNASLSILSSNYPFDDPLPFLPKFSGVPKASHNILICFHEKFVSIISDPVVADGELSCHMSITLGVTSLPDEGRANILIATLTRFLGHPIFQNATAIQVSFEDFYDLNILYNMHGGVWSALFDSLPENIRELALTMLDPEENILRVESYRNGFIEALSENLSGQREFRFRKLENLTIMRGFFSDDEGKSCYKRLTGHLQARNRTEESACRLRCIDCFGIDRKTQQQETASADSSKFFVGDSFAASLERFIFGDNRA